MSEDNNVINEIEEERKYIDKKGNIFSDKRFKCECQCKCEDDSEKCLPFKKNCNDRCCEAINEKSCNIKNPKCTPILSKKVFDCISLEQKQFSFLEDVIFTIEDDLIKFDFKESICIDKIGIEYTFIGLNTNSNSTVLVDSKSYVFNIPCEKIFSGCNSYLYNENNIAVTTGKYCCNESDNEDRGIKTRILEKDLDFLVCGLKIFVEGRIGCKEFRAIKDFSEERRCSQDSKCNCNCNVTLITPPAFPISIKKLGFNPITFIGRVCLPQGAKKAIIHQKFNNCLFVECVTPKNNHICDKCSLLCGDRPTFKADVELSLISNKLIYSTIRENLDVFVNSDIEKYCNENLKSICKGDL